MASLFHDVVAGKVCAVRSVEGHGYGIERTKRLASAILPSVVFTLNIGEWSDQWDFAAEKGHKAVCLIPRNERLWIEGAGKYGPIAVYLMRSPSLEPTASHDIGGVVWGRPEGHNEAAVFGTFVASLGDDGHFISGDCGTISQGRVLEIKAFMAAALWVCFLTHCKNVRMVPIHSPKTRRRQQRDLTPMTVWHKIEATKDGVPKNLHGGCGIFRDESKMRQYRVRGTIRSAPNHPIKQFRGPFWIPDHWRGNEELGTVIPEYVM